MQEYPSYELMPHTQPQILAEMHMLLNEVSFIGVAYTVGPMARYLFWQGEIEIVPHKIKYTITLLKNI